MNLENFSKADRVEIDRRQNEETKIKTPQLERVAPELEVIASKIIESKKNYDLILSDDASARTVSLFLKKILGTIQKKRGLPSPDVRFVAGGTHYNEKIYGEISELLSKINPERILLVTEYIFSGNSIKRIIDVLESLGIEFDLAVVSSGESGLENVSEDVRKKPGQDVYLGSVGLKGASLHDKPKISGVIKDYQKSSPVSYKKGKPEDKKENIQSSINQARKDIDVLVERVLDRLADKI